jgi:thiamine biosynthesis lipoprotein
MNKSQTSSMAFKLRRTIALALMIFFAAGLCYHFIRSAPARNMEPETPESPAVLEAIGDDWWEAKQLIYHGIPARIVFLLPPAAGTDPDVVNEAVWHEFDRIGRIFNPFAPDSEISSINSAPRSDTISVSDDLTSVIRISKQLWLDSDGEFDPTMWQIKRLWQDAEKNQQIPSEKDINTALHWTGFSNVQLDVKAENSIGFKNHPVKFDFGGIVKGYAVDQVRHIFLSSGVIAGLVQLGGEISAFGNNNGKPWRIGIQHPKQMDKIWGIISSNGTIRVSTSGNYRQPVQINGKSFYHIFSPKTGKPVSEKVLGVSTASLDGKISNARLDGIATAITVMGASKGLALAEKLKIDAVILYEKSDGTIGELITPGLSDYYTPAEK